MVQKFDFELFVHPIAPVLNETRHVVRQFSSLLKSKVQAASSSPPLRGRLHYLDFFERLLAPGDPTKLNPELAFDGTHMAPAYVKFLAESLAKVQ
eukprot:CAMPEP_0202918646 /NCGR_PEP_ID=MMETSP1392-20130828/73955_1 /ASSEMBLY_ACC=CAM_ASM_000868 /TAXON_ID=225041 /ORGANISM="Chlamydomonas chlamydogama, Strain SAG 11-48b" /LENGTH=94 /DNA_ID=CAMNT_0049611769 /DNA_START=44 /DNA_END=328 /DNA_ORIENTATION=+